MSQTQWDCFHPLCSVLRLVGSGLQDPPLEVQKAFPQSVSLQQVMCIFPSHCRALNVISASRPLPSHTEE